MNNKVLRKALSVIVAAVMLLALLPNGFVSDAASYGNKAEFRVETVDADAGATNVRVKVFATADPHFGAVGFTFNFDPNKLVYKKWAWNPALNEQTLNGENNVSVINKDNAATTGKLIIAYTTTVQLGGYDGYYPVNEAGDEYDYIGTLYFDVKAGVPGGLAEISLTVDKLAVSDPDDPSGNGTIDVPFATPVNGGINVAGVAHEHSWSEWTVTKEATCTEAGSEERTCDCGEKETEEIPALGHDWGEWTVVKEATETENGQKVRVCSLCGERQTSTIPALGDPVAVNVVVDTVYADSGESNVQVKVFMTSEPHWASAGFTFRFDPSALRFVKWAWNPAVNEQTLNGENNISVINKNNASNGEIIISFVSAVELGGYEGYYPTDESGVTYDYVGIMTFDVIGEDSGLQEISVSIDKITDVYNDVPVNTVDGGVYISGAAHVHSFGAWVTYVEATCVSDGEMFRTCSRCGETETALIPALGHDWSEWTVTKEATASASGEESRYCLRCGETETRLIPPYGSDKVVFRVETVQAAPGDTGVQVKVFAAAVPHWGAVGFTFNFDPNKLVYKSWSLNQALNEQTLNGEINHSVINNNNALNGELIIVYLTTVQLGGYEGYYPVDESGNEYDYIGTLKFDVKPGIGSGLTAVRLTVDELVVVDPGNQSGIGTIDVPFQTFNGGVNVAYAAPLINGVENGKEYDLKNGKVAPTWEPVDATATLNGLPYNAGTEINVPGAYELIVTNVDVTTTVSFTVVDSTLCDHNWSYWRIVKRATCTSTGEKYRTCSICGYKETVIIPMLAHSYDEWIVTCEPDCTMSGEKYHVCTVCGTVETVEMPPLGHDWSEWEETASVSCTEAGEEARMCARCGMFEIREVPATGHDYSSTVVYPTCEEGGYTLHTCANCGSTYTSNRTYALGHDFGEWTVTTEPTCTDYGVETRYCSRCDVFEEREIAALGHDFSEPTYEWSDDCSTCTATCVCERDPGHVVSETVTSDVITIPATCEEAGENDYTARFTYFGFPDQYLLVDISPLGHDFGDWVVTKAPACTEDGVEERYCSRCDVFEEREIAALGHDYVAIVTEPTCEQNGYTTHICSRCGDSYVDSLTEPLGHQWSEWEVYKPATCLENGVDIRICERCALTETRVTYGDHLWSEWEVTVPNTYKSEGEEARICATCGRAETRVIPVAQITEISVTKLPGKTSYFEVTGELDLTDAELTLYYDNAATRIARFVNDGDGYKLYFEDENSFEPFALSGFDNTAVGAQTITVEYGGKTAEFGIEIIAKSVCGISIVKKPLRLEFDIGEQISINGGQIIVYYDNGESVSGKLMTLTGRNVVLLDGSSIAVDLTVEGYDSATRAYQLVNIIYEGFEDCYVVNVGKARKGDMDGDGEYTVADALIALRLAARLAISTPKWVEIADFDNDGEVTVADALVILRAAARLVKALED